MVLGSYSKFAEEVLVQQVLVQHLYICQDFQKGVEQINIGDNHSVYGGARELMSDIVLYLFYLFLSTLFS